MKRFYSIFLLAVAAILVNVQADAASRVSFTVRVNNPDYVKVEQYYYPGGTTPSAISFDSNNEAEVEFPDGFMIGQIRITPVTPEGSNPIYLTHYEAYDCDEELIISQDVALSTQRQISINEKFDGGLLYLVCEELNDKNISVNLNGDPAKVAFSVDGEPYILIAGENAFNIPADSKYLKFTPVGVADFFSLTLNGEDVNLIVDGLEGKISSYYSISNVKDNDRIEIITDYPDEDFKVNIVCNDPAFIKTVLVDDVECDDWSNLEVKAGQQVVVNGDSYYYNVNSCGLNDVVYEFASYDMSSIVKKETTFTFNVEKIERSGKFVAYSDMGEWLFANENHNTIVVPKGYTMIGVDPAYDGGFSLNCYEYPEELAGKSNIESFIFINDEYKEGNWLSGLALKDGDVVKMYLATEAPTFHNLNYVLDDFDGKPVVTHDMVNVIEDLGSHTVLPGTCVKVESSDTDFIKSVTVNGTPVEAVDGAYEFAVNRDSDVVITGKGTPSCVGSLINEVSGYEVYNLQGIRVNKDNLPAGLYIVNGKKVILK